jgi:hypothetical protein
MEEKEEIIEEIKKLIVSTKDDKIDINPDFLDYFQVEELISIRDDLKIKKSKIRETTFEFLDELYEKTKEDSL